ncbi:methyl-accepting chemotaxis protein [Pseudomonas sp. 5P_5.1_Bac1]|nr:methyl-accepting chemotaxis protein [Pseudomonas sp. 5P_5.1_Bac1]MCU1719959.1 methyl-accepting chemotaxis protein [Pseudomonas sp. 5P_5.1_Bac1]
MPLSVTTVFETLPTTTIGATLGRLSVGGKLSLGFALVLFCTLGMGLAAWYALQVNQASSARLSALERLHNHLVQARQAEKEFALLAGPESANRLESALHLLQGQVAEAQSGEAFERTLRERSDDYLQGFRAYATARLQAQDARLRMQALAQSAGQRFAALFIDQLDDINTGLEHDRPPDATAMQLLEDAATLRERLANLRDSELYFILDPQQRYRDDWVNRVSELGSALSNLAAQLEGDRRLSLGEAATALEEYRQAFLRYISSGEQAVAQQGSMNTSAQQAIQALDDERARASSAWETQRRRLDLQLAAMLVLALLSSVSACVLIRRSIAVPVRQMLALAQRVAAGDLQGRPPRLGRSDELGQLNDAIGVMLQALRELVGRIGEDADQLDAAAETLAEMVERTGRGVRAQRQQTGDVLHAMQAMTQSTVQVNQRVDGSQASLGEASALIHEGDRLVREASQSLQRLSLEMGAGTVAMQLLQSQSEAITGVLDVISAVAEQTNLLALNAAIEAARAGEHGRGFAVVADEVRGLASRTRASTGEIDGMIQRLGQVTRDAAASLEDSQRLTGEGVELTARASEVLAAITTSIVEVENAGRHIAEAARTQHHLAGRVDGAAGEVERVVEQNAEDCARLEEACGSLQRLSASLGQALGAFRRGA